jgi:hypothetical protein
MKLIYEVAKQETDDVDLLDEKWEFLQGMVSCALLSQWFLAPTRLYAYAYQLLLQ